MDLCWHSRTAHHHLDPGAEYASPLLHAAHLTAGLDGLSDVLHTHLRARPGHPRSPRPVTLNVWEAVYFDHDLDRLRALADRAAEVGVERFVLDDGWFTGRRHDRAGLGDWHVDADVWPAGLRHSVSAIWRYPAPGTPPDRRYGVDQPSRGAVVVPDAGVAGSLRTRPPV
ncbi:alpha-galactosidase [Micromonospora sp. NPDC092111]|uniref:alpha-galactosidase n=1 Tax=Micromonospora sp. NPDC092111 TaxID=3364289 RepID=UPI0038025A84